MRTRMDRGNRDGKPGRHSSTRQKDGQSDHRPGSYDRASSARPARQRHLLVEGLPGLAKTRAIKSLAKNLEASLSRIQFTPTCCPPTLPAPKCIQRRRQGRVQIPAGAGLRQSDPRRRDQPRAGKGAVGATGGDGGTAGHGRRQEPPAAGPSSWSWQRRTDRARRYLSPARGLSSTGS